MGEHVHAALAATLRRRGLRAIFGVMGDANMFLIDSLVRAQRVPYIAAANEAGAVLMAGGYAVRSGEVGVATVTYGPGLLNSIGTLVSVVRQRTPLVIVTGETAAARTQHSQRIDQAGFVHAAGAGYLRAESAADAVNVLERALDLALTERRPYVYACPVDFMFAEAGISEPSARPAAAAPALAEDQLDRAVGALATASRPLVVAGYGCVTSDAEPAVERLAATLGAPLLTTLPARGLFGHSERHLGVCGTFSSPAAVAALQAADCIVAIGTSMNQLTAGGEGWPYFAGKRLVQCNIDPAAIRTLDPSGIAVVADAAAFAEAATQMLTDIDHTPSGFGGRQESHAEESPHSILDTTLERLDALLPGKRMVTVDGGRFTAAAIARMQVADARSWACSFSGFGAVGNAVSTAIGMAVAAPEVTSVAVVGDGGFMLGGLAEFNTAVRHGVDLIVVVVNDGSYGAEHRKLTERGFDPGLSRFDWPSLAETAIALGGEGITVVGSDGVEQVAEAVRDRRRPLLIDLQIDAASA